MKDLGKGLWVTCTRKKKGILERYAEGNYVLTEGRQREFQAIYDVEAMDKGGKG